MTPNFAPNITQQTYEDAYARAHEERANAIRDGWNWLFSRSPK